MSTIKNRSRQWILGAVMLLLFNTVAMTQARSATCYCGLTSGNLNACDGPFTVNGTATGDNCNNQCGRKTKNQALIKKSQTWRPSTFYENSTDAAQAKLDCDTWCRKAGNCQAL